MTYQAQLSGGEVRIQAPDGVVHALDHDFVARVALEARRPVQLRDLSGANFDDSPVLVVNRASLRAFATEAGMPIDHRRFRANVYVEGLDAYEELSWLGTRIRAGEAELEVVARCERCVVITRDPDSTKATPELLRLLADRHDTRMGVYCRVARPGRLATGDFVG